MADKKDTTKAPAKPKGADPKAVEKLLGKERINALSNQAACEVNGGFAKVLQGSCIAVAGMYQDKPGAKAAQAAIFVIQGCGSKPGKDDLVALMEAAGKQPVALRDLKAREARARKKQRANKPGNKDS